MAKKELNWNDAIESLKKDFKNSEIKNKALLKARKDDLDKFKVFHKSEMKKLSEKIEKLKKDKK